MPQKFISHSRESTQVRFEQLSSFFPHERWLSRTNRYRNNIIGTIREDNRLGISENTRNLSHYISASAPVHCLDGWGFLGKSMHAFAVGDKHAAKHFAYYAELRAVMSFLAAEGIGIFDKIHYEVDTSSSLRGPIRKQGTHIAAAEALDEWLSSPNSQSFFNETIRPEGIPLGDWFNAFSRISTVPWSTQEWLKSWGYDLNKFKDDRDARNYSSYRPTHFYRQNRTEIKKVAEVMENIWTMLSPIGSGGYEVDLHLFKKGLRSYYNAIHPRGRRTRQNIIDALGRLGFSDPKVVSLTDFLMSDDEPLLLKEADKKNTNYGDDLVQVHMMCRAVLLLRVATGASMVMLNKAHFNQTDLKFWWESICSDRGILDDLYTGDPFLEMWVDVDDALNNLRTNHATISSSIQWRRDHAQDILTLSGCERIGLAGLNI